MSFEAKEAVSKGVKITLDPTSTNMLNTTPFCRTPGQTRFDDLYPEDDEDMGPMGLVGLPFRHGQAAGAAPFILSQYVGTLEKCKAEP